ncbi:MAG: SRPBCC domain-containing protein [Rhodococcus sp. (in: high G+C Gram-positive bacteria)]|uniref:SRPBCC domain-containing protein n=1 Tax=Rhodococcus sp. TaxID=1831 RepID=UPI003BB62F0B
MAIRDPAPSPLRYADIIDEGEQWTLVFTRDFPQTPEAMWIALTDPAQVVQWAPYRPERPLGTIGPATLVVVCDSDTGEATEVDGTVVAANCPHVLEHRWDEDWLRWEITPASGGGCVLTLQHTVTGPNTAAQLAARWHLRLDVAQDMMEHPPTGPIAGHDAPDDGWTDLYEAYSERLGGTES